MQTHYHAGNLDTECDPEEMFESKFFETEDERGPTENIWERECSHMQNGILYTVAQSRKGSQMEDCLMNSTECSFSTPLTCNKNHRELGVFTPREDDHRVSPGEGSNILIGPWSLTPERLQASGVGVISAQSSSRNDTEDSSCERAFKVSCEPPVGCIKEFHESVVGGHKGASKLIGK